MAPIQPDDASGSRRSLLDQESTDASAGAVPAKENSGTTAIAGPRTLRSLESPFRPRPLVLWITGGLLLSGFFFFNIFLLHLMDWADSISDEIGATLLFSAIGVVLAQVNLVAMVASLAPGKMTRRLPLALMFAVLIWLSLVVGNYRVTSNVSAMTIYTLGFCIAFGVIVIYAPLALVSRYTGWQMLVDWDIRRRDERFGILSLMMAVTLVAASLGLARLLLPRNEPFAIDPNYQLYVFVGMIAVANLAVIAPGIWVSFLSGRRLRRFGAVWMIAVIVAGIFLGIGLLAMGGGPVWAVLPVSCMMVTEALTVFLTMRLLRGAGYLLLRL